jgi:PH (Pleckstrin Homology) domain-containing protein
MVSRESVEGQLVRIGFNFRGFLNRGEIRELPKILLPDEEIYECVNGFYEGGVALLAATNVRVLLIDKKPFNFLTVEDVRFDMINEMDYSHRLMGAQISISVGSKNMVFRSYNQPRLRKLIGHVQHCIAEAKKKQTDHQEDQSQHLERINQQLQAYLLAQFQSQMEFNQRLQRAQMQGKTDVVAPPEAVKPSPELADYLYSQSLLREHANHKADDPAPITPPDQDRAAPRQPAELSPMRQSVLRSVGPQPADANADDLYAEGWQEVFGKRATPAMAAATPPPTIHKQPAAATQPPQGTPYPAPGPGLEINPLRIAYSKLPMALRNRKFGRPSFHAHSRSDTPIAPVPSAPSPLS